MSSDRTLGVRRTCPHLHLTVDQRIAGGDRVVTRVTMRGTHHGAWQGIKPTGIPEMTPVNIDRVVGGRIVEHGGAANLLEHLLRSGATRVVGGEVERVRDSQGDGVGSFVRRRIAGRHRTERRRARGPGRAWQGRAP